MDFSLIFCEFLSMVVVGVLLLWICHGGGGFFFDFFFWYCCCGAGGFFFDFLCCYCARFVGFVGGSRWWWILWVLFLVVGVGFLNDGGGFLVA